MESEEEVRQFNNRGHGLLSVPKSAQWPSFLAVTTPLGRLPLTRTKHKQPCLGGSACIPGNAGCCSPLLSTKAPSWEERERWVPSWSSFPSSQGVFFKSLKLGRGIGALLGKAIDHLVERDTFNDRTWLF